MSSAGTSATSTLAGDRRPGTAREVRVHTGPWHFSVAEQTAWEPQTLPLAPFPLTPRWDCPPCVLHPMSTEVSQALGLRLGVPSRVMEVRSASEGWSAGKDPGREPTQR